MRAIKPLVNILPGILFISGLSLATTVLMLSNVSAAPAKDDPVVIANGEELHGNWDGADNRIATFKGIPFAQPPVGSLRWRAPLANQPRPGPQSAAAFAPACMQTAYMTDWYANVAKAFGAKPKVAARPNGVSEDCLYLNVWSPELIPPARLPVMVWVHGGSNRGGWSYEPNYVGTRLATKDVVVVSITYRLGALGFFSHPAIDNGPGHAVANFGILDIQQALQWIRDNITAFGGDPQNVTLMGESAGAGNISDLVTMSVDKTPFFRKVILQSSASGLGQRRSLADERETGRKLVASLGLDGTPTADQLRGIPAADLLRVSMSETDGHYFDAVIDGLTMSRSPFETLQKGFSIKLNVLVGTNADEWFMYTAENSTRTDVEKAAHQIAPHQASGLIAATGQVKDPRSAMDRLQTAQGMLCPSRYLAARVTELGGRGWMYYFSRQRPGIGGEELGAYHGTEIPYVFDMHDDWLPVEDIDIGLTEAVMDYWVQFARSGNPNVPNRPQWPVYEQRNPLVMELGDKIGVVKPPDTGLCELLGPDKKNTERGL